MATVVTCSCGKRLLVHEDCPAGQGVCPGCGQIIDLAPYRHPISSAVGVTAETPTPLADAPWEEIHLLPGDSAADAGGPKRYRPLYSPRAVALAALLGGLAAGCLMLAGNYRKLHRKRAAWLAAFIGIAGTGITCGIVVSWVHVPAGLGAVGVLAPVFVLQLLVPAVLLYAAARTLQGGAFAAHVQQGGKAASIGSLAPLCLFVTGLTFFLQALLSYPATWDGTGGSLVFGRDERLFYTDGVSLAEARQLGAMLQEVRIFDDRGIKTVVVLPTSTGFTIRVFTESAEPDPRSAAILREAARQVGELDNDFYQVLCRRISRDVFAGEPVEMLLFDLAGVPQRSVRAIADEAPAGRP
ncbi:hypothetical protein AYO44_09590 [Planctomycetaceae bacterium SCGC AG-212-F19]|nr:hypothetical protein AYO44_09590 [Planctomycetaceae bacterium SCGC AG-212-F19]